MKNQLLAISASLILMFQLSAQESTDSNAIQITEIESSMKYQTGVIKIQECNATLSVPKGFKYLDREQSNYVLHKLWGNPPDSTTLGMLFPESMGVLDSSSWAFTIEYDPMGYVKDDDAEDINYDDLLKEQQKETREANPMRISQGYQAIDFIGWASAPYYDKEKKTLHWAKELKFGDSEENTLNYNLRILGRKGVFILTAVATVKQLNTVKASINDVLNSVQFDTGSKYSDFDPGVDQVAAWTVGGLVAGKVLAKVGFFAILLKFWKLILVGLAAFGAGIMKLFGKKKKEEEIIPEDTVDNSGGQTNIES